jgi:hypothetical protein
MAVSATTLRVQEFDKGRGPVGLPPIGQACDLPAWPDQDRRPYRRIGYCQTREIATGLGLAVGALAGMFYDAVPKFSYAFIARMTIHISL